MEVGLEGQLHPLLAHDGVVGVAQLLIDAPLIGVDRPHPAQQVGGVGGLILPGGGDVDADAGQVGLLHLDDEGQLHVLGEGIGVVGDLPGAEGELVPHPHQGPELAVGQEGVDLVVLRQGLQEGGGAGAAVALPRLGGGPDGVGLGPVGQARRLFDALRQGVEVADGAGGGGVEGEDEGGLRRDGQGVGPGHLLGPADVQEPAQGAVHVLHEGGVQAHVVALPVGDQHPAVAVQDVAPGGLHRLGLGDLPPGLRQVVGAVDVLEVVEDPDEEEKDEEKHARDAADPPVELLAVHGGSFLGLGGDGFRGGGP